MLLKNTSLNQIIIKRTITISPNTSLLDAREILLRHNLKRLVVINAKKCPVGIITEKDILSNISNVDVMTTKIEDYMTRDVNAFGPNSDLGEICECLLEHDFHQVPIVNSNRLVGIITRSDVLKARMRFFKL